MQLAAESALLRELMDGSEVLIAALDQHGVVVACNEKLCRQSGRTREQLVGKNLRDICRPAPVLDATEPR